MALWRSRAAVWRLLRPFICPSPIANTAHRSFSSAVAADMNNQSLIENMKRELLHLDINSQIGSCMPLGAMRIGTIIHNIEMNPGQGGKLVRAAGTSAKILKEPSAAYCIIRLPSGAEKRVDSKCRATVGVVSNPSHGTRKLRKAGQSRWLGRRPVVRGVAMNPIDHPHGGGEAWSHTPQSKRSPIALRPTKKHENFDFFPRPISFQKIPTKNAPQLQSSPSPPSSTTNLQPIEDLPPKLQEIIRLFQSVQEPKAKYEQLMSMSYLDEHKNVLHEADSDSVLTKGLAALLVNGLSGRPVEEILRVSPDFAVLLGLQQSLTPSRNNGFLNMLKLMQRKALELLVEAEKDVGSSNSGSNCLENRSTGGSSIWSFSADSDGEDLTSEKHAGNAGVKASNEGETHFNVRIVSKQFEGKSLIKRNRTKLGILPLIYGLLHDELHSGLHALSIMANTPSEADAG
ncbi:hypothetical protein SLEP1_g45489 [Rubroshorea leprosula]|uniref:Large ribosomal subunit protein uL2 C-terminal domain-containing protein n=1 Tax=Rubroshorea leprosula TaxID=152421 RepID=A0AAV5LJB1_9ROSI|nr:hypothetical protein SLEP1_g45489 [Rubroshorea leprosula]